MARLAAQIYYNTHYCERFIRKNHRGKYEGVTQIMCRNIYIQWRWTLSSSRHMHLSWCYAVPAKLVAISGTLCSTLIRNGGWRFTQRRLMVFSFFFLPVHVLRGDPKLNCKIILRWELTGCVSTARCGADGVYHLNLQVSRPTGGSGDDDLNIFKKRFDVQRCSAWKEVCIYIYTGLHARYC